MSFLDDLRNLDRNNVGGWSKSVKVFFASLIVILILLLGWYFKIRDQQAELRLGQVQLLLDLDADDGKDRPDGEAHRRCRLRGCCPDPA